MASCVLSWQIISEPKPKVVQTDEEKAKKTVSFMQAPTNRVSCIILVFFEALFC